MAHAVVLAMIITARCSRKVQASQPCSYQPPDIGTDCPEEPLMVSPRSSTHHNDDARNAHLSDQTAPMAMSILRKRAKFWLVKQCCVSHAECQWDDDVLHSLTLETKFNSTIQPHVAVINEHVASHC